jgi:hypothetical protein
VPKALRKRRKGRCEEWRKDREDGRKEGRKEGKV